MLLFENNMAVHTIIGVHTGAGLHLLPDVPPDAHRAAPRNGRVSLGGQDAGAAQSALLRAETGNAGELFHSPPIDEGSRVPGMGVGDIQGYRPALPSGGWLRVAPGRAGESH